MLGGKSIAKDSQKPNISAFILGSQLYVSISFLSFC